MHNRIQVKQWLETVVDYAGNMLRTSEITLVVRFHWIKTERNPIAPFYTQL